MMQVVRFFKILCNWFVGLGFIFVAWFGVSNNMELPITLFPFPKTWDVNFGVILFSMYSLGVALMLLRMIFGRFYLSAKISRKQSVHSSSPSNSSSDSSAVNQPRADY